MKNTLTALAAVLMLATSAQAHGFKIAELEVGHPFVTTPLATAKSAAGYLSVKNTGATADRLIAVESDAAQKVQIHTTEFDAEGIARMKHVEAVDLPAGAEVRLEQGALHVMFMGLTAPMHEGSKIPGTLVFEKAGRLAVEFAVDAPKADAAPEDHSGH